MLYLRKLLRSKPKLPEGTELEPLYTTWGEKLAQEGDAAVPLPEHPHPQFERERWHTLNGWWDYAIVDGGDSSSWQEAEPPSSFSGRILVPFSPEALLSGVGHVLQPSELLWYRRSFTAPSLDAPDDKVVLHFEAVDYACACYVNGRLVGRHKSGYLPFSFDITELLLEGDQPSELALCVWDPSNTGTQPRGKQRLDRGGIWYTPQSGIWQSVWLEVVSAAHMNSVSFDADPQSGILELRPLVEGRADLDVHVLADGKEVASLYQPSFSGGALMLKVERPRLWSPNDPFLYTVELRFGADEVKSYCAFRSVSMARDEAGHLRFCLNGKPLFLRGLLDQGYWSDGLLTAPSDEALAFDVQTAHDLGFNLLRKHIKVERDRWYWHCDRLGMLVLQDMVSGGEFPYNRWHTSYKPSIFRSSWRRFRDTTEPGRRLLSAADPAYREEWFNTCASTVMHLKNHPSIVAWGLFNEGWGQFDSSSVTRAVRELDTSRFVDAASGWYDQGAGDFQSVHNYFRTLAVYRDFVRPARAFFISEFGGLSLREQGHCALPTSYGYEELDDGQAYVAGVKDQIAQVEALEEKGLAGFVYTQLSDVEEETNGLLTYDRRVCKLPGPL